MSRLETNEKVINGGVPLSGDFKVLVEPTNKKDKVNYVFKEGSRVISEYPGVIPIRISSSSNIAREIKKYLDPNGDYKTQKLNSDFDKIKQILQEQYETSKLISDELKEMKKQEKEQFLAEHLKTAENDLEKLDQPLLWIASIIEWLTAGERNNILLTFVAYASQVILKNPISIIGLGEGGSGKTHIQDLALSFIPDDFIVDEKKISEPAMFNRAKEDPYFYDGKIVNYGDLGGANDQDFIVESKNLLKELQSDGKLNKPLSMLDSEGNWVTKDLKLLGRPCLTYTTVPGYQFDDQEKSRSIFISPRMNNKGVFNKRKSMLEMRGVTYKQMKKFENDSKIIQFMVLHLREVLSEVNIVNPYVSLIIDFLSESDYFKRDFDKYNGILKTITALNYYNKNPQTSGDEKIIYSTLEDVQLFFSLLRPYHSSIQFNISPKAADVLTEIRENITDWEKYYSNDKDIEQTTLEAGITTNDYFEEHTLRLSKRSVQKYFKELNEAGFIKVVSSKGRTSIWNLTGCVDDEDINNMLILDDEAKDSISYELGEDVKEVICNDKPIEGLNILIQYSNVDIPPWNKFDKEEYKIKRRW